MSEISSGLHLGLRRPVGARDVLRLGWDRAVEFGPLLRRDTRASRSASRTWTWQWWVVGWQASVLVLWLLPETALTARWTWLGTRASALVLPATGRGSDRRPLAIGAVSLAAAAYVVDVSVTVLAVLLPVLVGPIGWFLPVLWLVPLLLLVIRSAMSATRGGGGRALRRRARTLISVGGDAYVVAAVMARPANRGHGTALMAELGRLLDAQEAAAILFAGSEDLVDFYLACGWRLVTPASRRMVRLPAQVLS